MNKEGAFLEAKEKKAPFFHILCLQFKGDTISCKKRGVYRFLACLQVKIRGDGVDFDKKRG